MAWQVGVDVGGTFTDLLALDPEHLSTTARDRLPVAVSFSPPTSAAR
jgi:N-methylhydantoinase A/oxoprolinase/acetone carboxylase beta subunit